MNTPDVERDRPVVNLSGARVALGPMRRELLPIYLRWFNDPTALRTLHHPRQTTLEELTSSFDALMVDPSAESFTIYEVAGWRPIGNCGLVSVDERDRTAEFEIVIGEADARGRGYGTEATRLALDHAFTVLGMRNIMLKVYAFNQVGIRAYEKAGFKQFGRRRQATEMNGAIFDVIYMECLRTEFESPVLGRLFQPDTPR
jgi:RimJ/RimL family protein N-acetyltransferase